MQETHGKHIEYVKGECTLFAPIRKDTYNKTSLPNRISLISRFFTEIKVYSSERYEDGLVPSILCVVLVKWTFNSSGSAAIGLGLGLIIRSSSTKVPLAFSTKVPFDRTYVLPA